MEQQLTRDTQEIVLRNYIQKDTPENKYRTLQSYHFGMICLFLFWMFVRVLEVLGTQFYTVSDTAVSLMPVEIRAGIFGAFICVLCAAFNLAVSYGISVKESWGWWLALIGLCWGIVQMAGDSVIATMTRESMVVPVLHISISFVLCLLICWLIHVQLSPGMRVKFDVQAKPWVALIVGCLGGLTLGVIFLASVWPKEPTFSKTGNIREALVQRQP